MVKIQVLDAYLATGLAGNIHSNCMLPRQYLGNQLVYLLSASAHCRTSFEFPLESFQDSLGIS